MHVFRTNTSRIELCQHPLFTTSIHTLSHVRDMLNKRAHKSTATVWVVGGYLHECSHASRGKHMSRLPVAEFAFYAHAPSPTRSKPLGPTRSAACVFPRASAVWGGPLGVVPHSRTPGHSVLAGSKLYNILRERKLPLGLPVGPQGIAKPHPGHNFKGVGGGRAFMLGARMARLA